MPMPSYPLLCYQPGCGQLARFKIAARWSDGHTEELKTYGLTCERCLAGWYQRALARQKICRLARDESLETPGIYELVRGQLDRERIRRLDLEKTLYRADPPEPFFPS